MKNKKGFTLVEVLVSIGLLALIGSVIGFSLNRIFKNNNIQNYNEFVEKVKSAGMLYVNNTVDVINDLNDASYKLIKIKVLIDNGYINENIVNPNTGEKIDKEEQIKASYDSDHELTIEYPYENTETEAYLYTLNYTITYGDTRENLCYIELNNPGLQLIYLDGSKKGNLEINKNIKAYLENGEECTNSNLSSSKIGTYKVIYKYTNDLTNLNTSNNVKSAERTITVKPSKPIIDTFNITYQKTIDNTNFNIYDSKIELQTRDVKGVKLKYCIVGVKSEDNTEVNSLIAKCSDKAQEVNNVKQLNNNWIELNNGSNSNNQTIYTVNKNFNIEKEMAEYKDYTEIKFYVFVKNAFEEYDSKINGYNNGIYQLKVRVRFNANAGSFNNGGTINDVYISYGNTFKSTKSASTYQEPTRNGFMFEGWKDSNENIISDTMRITANIEILAKWYQLCVKTSTSTTDCTVTCGGGTRIVTITDTKYGTQCNQYTENCNTQACVIPRPSITCVNGSEEPGVGCDCSGYQPPYYVGIYKKTWKDANGKTRCCCGN